MIEERLKGYEVGADDYMTKPFVPEELLAKSKVFLKLTQMERELIELNQHLDAKVKERTKQLLDAEAKLVQSAKMSALGEMAGGIAHEINTPLGTIGMLSGQVADLIDDETINRKMVKEIAGRISTTVTRIGSIISGLRTFSRDGSKDPFISAAVKQLVEGTLALCRDKSKSTDVKIEMDPISEDFKIKCRPTQISQVLLNLVSNACDAVAPLGERWVRVSVEAPNGGKDVCILVTDSGSGIPKETAEKLFQPFFTTKELGKGTGLGLSIAKGLIDAHSGSLTLDNECKNTRFVIRLPRAE
jgi:C4-dicarboxylate-specific signal transduction histidine kinase